MSFDLVSYITDVRNAYRTRNGALLYLAEFAGRSLAEPEAQLHAAESTLRHLRGDGQPITSALDTPSADVAEAVEIAHLVADDYDALHSAFVTVARVADAQHEHADGAGAQPWCPVCTILAHIPARIVQSARANQGAQQ